MPSPRSDNLSKRILVSLVLLPIGLALVALGGWVFALAIALILGLAVSEYAALFRAGGVQASPWVMITGISLLAFTRQWDGFASMGWVVSLIVMAAMTWHLVAFEHGRDAAASDFTATLGGVFYIGWLGSYFISLRSLPEGVFWVLTVLPAVWIADSAAYWVGSHWGRRKLSPRLSPKKTWEGYLGGVVAAVVGTALVAAGWQAVLGSASAITPLRGAVLGLALSVLPTLGDLGESMIKRQVGMKDSGTLLPGHGGVFDRIDSWLWAAVIGYYLIAGLFLG